MNELQKKNYNNLYFQARLECKKLVSYGRDDDEIKSRLENSFYPDSVIKKVLEELPSIKKEKNFMKLDIKLPPVS